MANLATFGAAETEALNREDETFDTVTAFGVEIRIVNDPPMTLFFELGGALVDDDQVGLGEMGMVYKFLRGLIHPEDWRAFWSEVRKRRDAAETSKTLRALLKFLVEHIEGRPTDRASDSSNGPSTTGNVPSSSSSNAPTSTTVTVVEPFTAAPGQVPLPEGTIQLPNGSYLYPDGTGGYTPSAPASS